MTAIYTAVATSIGREGRSFTDDGKLDLALALPGSGQEGTNPEQLFAVGYSACFASAMKLVAKNMDLDVSDASVTAEVSLHNDGGRYSLSAVLRAELPEELHGEIGEKLLEATHQVCPYSHATRGNIPVEIVIE